MNIFKFKHEEKKIPMLIWKKNEDGGIRDNYEVEDDPLISIWNINGKDYRFKVDGGGSLVPPPVDQPPEKLARLVGCRPRQRLNASDKDWLQKLAPYAPVVVIVVCLIFLLIMMG